MDWGAPGPAEAGFDLDAYGARAAAARRSPGRARLAGGPVPVVGYCMGGTLAVGLAARAPEDVAALVTIGAPWDFASTRGLAGGLRAMIRAEGAARQPSGCSTASAPPSASCRCRCSRCSSRSSTRCRRR